MIPPLPGGKNFTALSKSIFKKAFASIMLTKSIRDSTKEKL